MPFINPQECLLVALQYNIPHSLYSIGLFAGYNISLTLCTPASTLVCNPQTSKNTFTTLYEHIIG